MALLRARPELVFIGHAIDAMSDEDGVPIWQPPPANSSSARGRARVKRVIDAAKRLLPEADVAMLVASYLDGYSQVEIAVIHGLTQARVSQRLKEAKRVLRRELADPRRGG